MQKAIYKITNTYNHKAYIGQSLHPEERFREHCAKTENYRSLIHNAILKYGVSNFTFEILGWYEDYNEKEKYWIDYYRTQVPYGYNIQSGGEEPPHWNGEGHPNATISKEIAMRVITQLLDFRIPRKTIIHNNHLTQNIIRHINDGTAWRQDNLIYPLRPPEEELDAIRARHIQWLCCYSDKPLNQLGQMVGWNKSSAKMINSGNNHFDDRLRYPIRNNKEYNKQFLDQKTCTDYLHFGE